MCIISILPKGKEKLTDETINFITNGFDNNADGSGFMYKKNGENEIYVSKGYFTLDWLLQDIKDSNLTKEDELVIHHRIGNIGSKNELNTHPFVCSFIEDDIHSVFGKKHNKPCLVHNGTLTNIYDFRAGHYDKSDTYAFARFIMSNIHLQNLLKYNLQLFTKVMEPYINTGKMCFLFPDTDLVKFGQFIEEDGYFHSNLGYKDGYYRDYGGTFKKKEEPKPAKLPHQATFPTATEYLKDYTMSINKLLTKGAPFTLDGRFVRITDYNYMNFVFMKKDLNNIFYTKVFKFNSFDQKCLLNVLNFDNNTLSVNEHALHTEYYFGPINSVSAYYKEYLTLLRDLEPSKKVMKKMYNILSNSKHKSDDFKLFNQRLGVYYSRFALIEYYNYFKEDYLKDPNELDYTKIKAETLAVHISTYEVDDDNIAHSVRYENTLPNRKEWDTINNVLS